MDVTEATAITDIFGWYDIQEGSYWQTHSTALNSLLCRATCTKSKGFSVVIRGLRSCRVFGSMHQVFDDTLTRSGPLIADECVTTGILFCTGESWAPITNRVAYAKQGQTYAENRVRWHVNIGHRICAEWMNATPPVSKVWITFTNRAVLLDHKY
jgi:hypothetical protein